MTFLPVVARELTVTARRAATYWLRFWAALAVLAAWLFLLATAQHSTPAQLGQLLLNALGILALAFSLFAGVFLTADCLSEEKREGTLGLLFLTDLRGHDVVLGKLAASSLQALFSLVATFPILGLSLLLGGVTGPEFTRLALVFAITLFFSLGLGMFVSAVSNESRQATVRTVLLLVIFAGIFPACWIALSLVFAPNQGTSTVSLLPPHLLLSCPVFTYLEAFDTRYRFGSGAHHFWMSLGILFALGFAGVALAAVALPRMWRDSGNRETKTRRSHKLPLSGKKYAARRSLFLQFNPCYWLALRESSTRRASIWTLAVIIPVWGFFLIASVISNPTARRYQPEIPYLIALFIAYGLHTIMKVLVAIEASRRIHQDRQSGALEILLATPVAVRAILDGHKRALSRHFRWAWFALVFVNLAMWVAALSCEQLHMDSTTKTLFSILFMGGLLVLFTDFHALIWVGLWRGLGARKHAWAVVSALGRVLGPGWMVIFLFFVLQPNVSEKNMMLLFGGWFAAGIAVDTIVGMIACLRLRVEFRRVAAEGLTRRGAA